MPCWIPTWGGCGSSWIATRGCRRSCRRVATSCSLACRQASTAIDSPRACSIATRPSSCPGGSSNRRGTCGSVSVAAMRCSREGWPTLQRRSMTSRREDMMITRRIAALAIGLAVALFTRTPLGQTRTVKALVGGTLIDGNASRPIQNSVIIIERERVRAVGQIGTLAVPAGAEVISTEGMTVLPGLWDMHVHLQLVGHSDYDHWDKTYPPAYESIIFPAAAKQLLLAGVTSARDLGGPLAPSISARDRINAGKIPGPTMYVSGPFIQHAPYPGTEAYRWGVNGPEDAQAKVRKLVDGKVDVIKLIDQDEMTMEEVRAVVAEAHRLGKPVVAHAHRPEEIRRALAAGVDCLEHTGLATAPEYPPDIIAMLRERTSKMSLGPLWWTPTVEGLLNYEYFRDR